MKKLTLVAALAVACTIFATSALAAEPSLVSASAHAQHAKKQRKHVRRCKKRIHGHVRRVRCKAKKKSSAPPATTTASDTQVPANELELPLPDGAPHILYTDIVSGPNSGGENNQGAYLSIFGKNFGSGGLGSTLRAYINNVEVGSYRSLGTARGRSDVQELVVQVGSLGDSAPGVNLPIKVTVGGVASNSDHSFMIQPGRMLFVDNVNGDDATAVPGDITHPYRHVQTTNLGVGAWGAAEPGDFIVMRGGVWTDVGRENYFMRFIKSDYSSGTAPSGTAGHGPITLMGYPGDDAFIDGLASTHPSGAISGLNGQTYPNAGKWVVISNLRIEGGGYDGPISQEIYGDNWRIVNNELTAYSGVTSGPSASRMAGITGNGANAVWMGNDIHDIHGSSGEAHGIYIDGDGSYDIGYNNIHDIFSGNGFQMYANGGNGSDYIDDVNFHHNEIANVSKHLINIADGSRDRVAIWDNIAHGAAFAGLRFNTTDLHDAKIFNNTFYDMHQTGTGPYGALTNDWGLPSDALDLRNNIFALTNGSEYAYGSVGFGGTIGTITNNLYFGGSGQLDFDSHPLSGDPKFVAPGTDFTLQPTSAAIDTGSGTASTLATNDFSGTTSRPLGNGIDVGAYEH